MVGALVDDDPETGGGLVARGSSTNGGGIVSGGTLVDGGGTTISGRWWISSGSPSWPCSIARMVASRSAMTK